MITHLHPGATPRRYRNIEVRPIAGALGAEISGVDASTAVPADVVAEEVEGSLDSDRVGLHLQEVVRRPERLVHTPRLGLVALLVEPDHLLDLRPADV